MRPDLPRTQVRRLPHKAVRDIGALYAVLDAAQVAHVAVVQDGQPFVLPMACARADDQLLLHGSTASRLMAALAAGAPTCATVTLLDGLVLARSAFHHSVNYRSVVIRGLARRVSDPDALAAGFTRLVDHAVPGRAAEARAPDRSETRQTMLLEVPLADASVKARTGGPVDDDADLSHPIWAGVIPLRVVAGAPEAAPDLPSAHLVPPAAVTLPGAWGSSAAALGDCAASASSPGCA